MTDPGEGPRRRLVAGAALFACASVALAFAFALSPDPRGFGTHESLGLRPCLFTYWTGYPCPGCGLTTSIVCAVHGRFAESFAAHPAGLPITAVLVWIFVLGASSVRPEPWFTVRVRQRINIVLGSLVTIAMVTTALVRALG